MAHDPPRRLVVGEAACLHLAQQLGLTNVDARLEAIGGSDCLIVSRFDRVRRDDGGVARIHQEDACQAVGRDPSAARGRGKYEGAGGPSLREVAGLLDAYARDPLGELDRLVAAVVFTVLVGNADAHGKNLAFLHEGAGIRLAPLYDVVPTVLWPELRRAPAMSVGSRVATIDRVTTADLLGEVKTWSHRPDRARAVMVDLVGLALKAVQEDDFAHQGLAELVEANAARLLGA